MSDKFKEEVLKELGFLGGESVGEDIVLFTAVVLSNRGNKVIPTFISMCEDGKTTLKGETISDNGRNLGINYELGSRLSDIMREWVKQASKLVKCESAQQHNFIEDDMTDTLS